MTTVNTLDRLNITTDLERNFNLRARPDARRVTHARGAGVGLNRLHFDGLDRFFLSFGFAAYRQSDKREGRDNDCRLFRVHLSSPIAFSKSAFAVQNASKAFW